MTGTGSDPRPPDADPLPDPRRPHRLVAPDTVGCTFLILWPIIAIAVVIDVAVITPAGSIAWILTALVLVALALLQGWKSEETADAAGRLYHRLRHDRPELSQRLLRGILGNEELIRSIVLPPTFGALMASLFGASPIQPLLAGFGTFAAVALMAWLSHVAGTAFDKFASRKS
jgi:hypothetical protein